MACLGSLTACKAACAVLQMGSFEMRVRRSSKGSSSGGMLLGGAYTNGASPIPVPPPGTAFASTASMDIPAYEAAQAPSEAVASVDEDIDDESTIFLTAPKAHTCLPSMTLRTPAAMDSTYLARLLP